MNGAICDLLEHEPANKEVADKIMGGYCPNCNAEDLIRWCPGSGFHDLCTHFHCMRCDADYCWPIAWEPPLPIVKMNGKLTPLNRRNIADICKRQSIAVPDFWKPIMESDLEPTVKDIILRCYECKKQKHIRVIFEAGYWHWRKGGYARGWVDTDNELYYDKTIKFDVLLARCNHCYETALQEVSCQK